MNYGVTFKGLHSYNDFKLIMLSDNRQVLADVVRQTKFVPGYGTVDFGNDTYNEKAIRVNFTYIAASLMDLQTQMEQVGGWLYNDGLYHDLIFDDAPLRKYHAKVTGRIDLSQSRYLAKLSIEFVCNPPYPFALDNSPVSPADVAARLLWDTALLSGTTYFQEFTADGNMKFTVGGTHTVKPVIFLIGYVPSGLQLTYITGGVTYYWKYNALEAWDTIVIDCDASTVKQGSDDANLYANVDGTKNTYFQLAAGQNSIAVAGVSGVFPYNLSIGVQFTPIP
jgi:predicted phage tail component-like protein